MKKIVQFIDQNPGLIKYQKNIKEILVETNFKKDKLYSK